MNKKIYKRIDREFYIKPTLKVAKALLGKYLVHKTKRGLMAAKIVETEAYIGPQDKASHAYLGKKTPRNKAEYYVGGHIYIYLVYGMHWQLNISTEKEDFPCCVLIRALDPMEGLKLMVQNRYHQKIEHLPPKQILNLTNGPGKLCQAFGFSKKHYGLDLVKDKTFYLEDRGEIIRPRDIKSGPRIGIDYAGPIWAKKPWRFWIKSNKFVSK